MSDIPEAEILRRLDTYLSNGMSTGLYRGAIVRDGLFRWSGHVWRIEDGTELWSETYRTKRRAMRRTGEAATELNSLIP